MTGHQVAKRVAEIEAAKDDDEMAHGMEDQLYLDVLTAIAERRCVWPAVVAREAIKAREIDFSRWCA